MAEFIWLDSKKYPEYIKNDEGSKFCIVRFSHEFCAPRVEKIRLKVCADAKYTLYINGKFIGIGPVSAGGDYVFKKMTYCYYDEYEIALKDGKADICAYVTSISTALEETVFGYCGFYLMATDEKGNELFGTDETWDAQLLSERKDVHYTDYTLPSEPVYKAQKAPDVHKMLPSPLEHLDYVVKKPLNFDKIVIKPNESAGMCLTFDKIYAAYPIISVKTQGKTRVYFETSEIDGVGLFGEEFITECPVRHFSPRMRSIGQIKIKIENFGKTDVCVEDVHIVAVSYPVKNETGFVCSDKLINKIYDVCKHTLKICRQSIHLDSPTHREPLACTGDYFIEALMEYMNIYDPTLTKFDIFRTSQFIELEEGAMFHTTYSLIYPEWVYDCYMYSGDNEIIKTARASLIAILSKFDTYISGNGLIEKAPNYMFVDWIDIDGYNLHHPPKALGQSVLCMFYYNAMNVMAKLFSVLNDEKTARECLKRAKNIKKAINEYLFDKEAGLYVGGLNTPNEIPDNMWLPANTDKKYYQKQANTLAVLYGIAQEENKQRIIEYILTDLKKEEMQPYFYHFLLEMLYKEGLFEKYGIKLISRYEGMIKKCDKGLCEGWEEWNGDCSHAWAGTPAYILKKALSGFQMIEPGYKKIKLSPSAMGLDFADFGISTPYGEISISVKNGGEVSVKAPEEIEIIR